MPRLLAERMAEAPEQAHRARLGDWLFVALMLAGLAAVFVALAALTVFAIAALWHAAASMFSAGR